MIMPFGKWQGYDLAQIPTGYLTWLSSNTDLYGALKNAVQAELDRREGKEAQAEGAVDALKNVYRSLAMKWHPDKGGNHQAMQAINEFYEKLAGGKK